MSHPVSSNHRLFSQSPLDRFASVFPPLTSTQTDAYKHATTLFTLRMLPTREQAPHLRYVHIFAAGTEHVSKHPLYHDSNVTFTSSSGSHGPQMAEWVMMTVLVQSHRLRELWRFQEQQTWGSFRNHFEMEELVGQRMGILGYGSIGRHGEFIWRREMLALMAQGSLRGLTTCNDAQLQKPQKRSAWMSLPLRPLPRRQQRARRTAHTSSRVMAIRTARYLRNGTADSTESTSETS